MLAATPAAATEPPSARAAGIEFPKIELDAGTSPAPDATLDFSPEAAERRLKADAERQAEAQREIEAKERLEREQAERAAQEQREREEGERREREAAARHAAEEEARRRAETERLAKAQQQREEKALLERERAERQAREQREREENERGEREAATRRAVEEEARRKAETERLAKEQAEREKRERAELAEREAATRQAAAAAAQAAAAAAKAAPVSDEAASLDFNAAAKADADATLDFSPASPEQRRKAEVDQLLSGAVAPTAAGTTPLAAGGPDTFADTDGAIDPFAADDSNSSRVQEAASRKEIEREAKERAKAEEKAKREAAAEAKRLAKESRVKVPRSGPSIGAIIGGVVFLGLIGGVAYLFMMPIDKAAIERALTERLGEPVTVSGAKFTPFPPELVLTGMAAGALKLNSVVARPDPTSLMSAHKIWKSVEVNGVSLDLEQARSVIALGTREVSKIVAGRVEIQRVRVTDAEVTGLPVAVPKFNIDAVLSAAGTLKQVTLAIGEDKARVLLQPDEKGWLIDIDSRGVTWPLGPQVAFGSLRAKGVATGNGIKFEDYSIGHFGGTSRGAGELSWNGGWKFTGNLDLGGVEAESLAQAFYGAAPVSGGIDGKLSVTMSAASLAGLFDTPQIDGVLSVNKAAVKAIDLARTAQSGTSAAGATRFSDFSTNLTVAAGKLSLKELKGVSGLLTVTGLAEVTPDKNLGGTLTVELGVGGSRAKAIVKLSGTVSDPKLAK